MPLLKMDPNTLHSYVKLNRLEGGVKTKVPLLKVNILHSYVKLNRLEGGVKTKVPLLKVNILHSYVKLHHKYLLIRLKVRLACLEHISDCLSKLIFFEKR